MDESDPQRSGTVYIVRVGRRVSRRNHGAPAVRESSNAAGAKYPMAEWRRLILYERR